MSATQQNHKLDRLPMRRILSACSDAKEDSICEGNDECIESSYCVDVYNDECPSMEDFENEYLLQESCNNDLVVEHVEATPRQSSPLSSTSVEILAALQNPPYTCYDTSAQPT